jgi:hypothetical protein
MKNEKYHTLGTVLKSNRKLRLNNMNPTKNNIEKTKRLNNSGIPVTRSLVLYVCFVDRCLSFCTFSFGHCVVGSSSIYGF